MNINLRNYLAKKNVNGCGIQTLHGLNKMMDFTVKTQVYKSFSMFLDFVTLSVDANVINIFFYLNHY